MYGTCIAFKNDYSAFVVGGWQNFQYSWGDYELNQGISTCSIQYYWQMVASLLTFIGGIPALYEEKCFLKKILCDWQQIFRDDREETMDYAFPCQAHKALDGD